MYFIRTLMCILSNVKATEEVSDWPDYEGGWRVMEACYEGVMEGGGGGGVLGIEEEVSFDE